MPGQLLTMRQCGDTSQGYGFARRLAFLRWHPYLKSLFCSAKKRPQVNHDTILPGPVIIPNLEEKKGGPGTDAGKAPNHAPMR